MNENSQQYWERDQSKIQNILQNGMPAYVANLPNVNKAFDAQPKTLRCIDERVIGNVALGGSGILLGLDQSYDYLKDAHLDAITSHQGCGAAALYCQQHGIDSSHVDETAADFAKQLAEKLGVPYTEHQPVAPNSHIARAIYYVGAETFNPCNVPELPAGFVVSRYYHKQLQTAIDEVALSIDIAFGGHGFGDLLKVETPLLIIAIPHPTDPRYSQNTLRAELQSLTHSQLDRVKILNWTDR